MRNRLLLALSLLPWLASPAGATSWGLNSFSDSVGWADAILIVQVERIVSSREKEGLGKLVREVDVDVRVVERFKGRTPEQLRVTDIDMGDPQTFSSPYVPLPDDLVGRRLLVFLAPKGKEDHRKARERFLVEEDRVRHVMFDDIQADAYPLTDVRAMVAQLDLIQTACPGNRHKRTNAQAALAACRTALHSRYDPVVWYGARRLLDLNAPADLVDDLIPILESQKPHSRVRYLLVQCLAKTGDPRAIPPLIDALRRDPQNRDVPEALKTLSGEDFGSDLDRWDRWWEKRDREEARRRKR